MRLGLALSLTSSQCDEAFACGRAEVGMGGSSREPGSLGHSHCYIVKRHKEMLEEPCPFRCKKVFPDSLMSQLKGSRHSSAIIS